MTTQHVTRWLAVLVSIWIGIAVLRATVGVTHGLRAEYFENVLWAGAPSSSAVDSDISTDRMVAVWLGDPPPVFSARWFGYLMNPRPGLYTFATRSDDGSFLRIDGRLVVDNGGEHPAQTRSGSIYLDRGPHFIALEYAQTAGEFELGWSWGTDAHDLAGVPSWRLSPNRVVEWKILLARTLDVLSLAALTCALLCGFWIVFKARQPAWTRVRQHRRAASFVLFVALAIAETWPLAAHPARLSRNDNADTILNEWTIAWVAHQAPRAPWHLYDANIFFPEHRTLAYSEVMIVQSAMAAPLLWLGASPVLAYNIVLIAGFALTGWAMSVVMVRWTESWVAGITSGILFAFNAHTFARLPHLQAQHVEFFPLALLALDLLLRSPRPRYAFQLALWFVLQALTSIYLLVFTAVSLIAAALVRPEDWSGRRFKRVAASVALAVSVATIALLPFVLPYWHLSRDEAFVRSLEDATGFAAVWQNYLSTVSRLHYNWWGYRFSFSPALFPGAIGLILALIAIVRGVAFKNPRARMCLAFGVVGVVLSFGTKVPGYATLYRFVPLLQAIRGVSRFGYLGIVAVAVVAGFGVVELRKLTPSRFWAPLAFLLPALAAVDASPAPIWYARFEGLPAIYRQLRDQPGAIVVELPFHNSAGSFHEARYMLNSTEHWKPMLNGYSGFQPISYHQNFEALEHFPDERSIDALRAQGVTHVFVHVSEMGPNLLDTLDRTAGFHKMSAEGDIVLYRFDPQ